MAETNNIEAFKADICMSEIEEEGWSLMDLDGFRKNGRRLEQNINTGQNGLPVFRVLCKDFNVTNIPTH